MTLVCQTLFRLPLRKVSSPSLVSDIAMTESYCLNLVKGSYQELAYHALFFTSLSMISAEYRSTQNVNSAVWSVSAERTERRPSADGFDHQYISLSKRDRDGSSIWDDWLITSSSTPLASVPEEHSDILDRHNLTRTRVGITVRIALHLTERSHSNQKYFLFSSLRLPVVTSLPVHLHAQFALASDRRGIRFDSPGRLGKRIPESAYNAWILSELVPRLYMFTLHQASLSLAPYGFKSNDNVHWWPHVQADPTSISGEVVEAFYRLLPKTAAAVCSTVTEDLVSPAQAVFSIEEPPAIARLLSFLRPPNYVCLPPKLKGFDRKHLLPTVTAGFVRTTIQKYSTSFMDLWRRKLLTIGDVDAVIQFLLANKTSLLDLPLLVLSDRSLVFFINGRDEVIYHSDLDLRKLFPDSASRFICGEFKSSTLDLLTSDDTISVEKFDSTGVLSLIRTRIPRISRQVLSQETADWIASLWESYDLLPGPFNPDLYRDLALFPIHNSREYVSLDLCRQGCLVSSVDLTPELAGIVHRLGILVIQTPPLPFSLLFIDKGFSLSTFLKSLNALDISLNGLSPIDCQTLAHWIRSHSPTKLRELPRLLRATVASLPVWSACKGSTGFRLLPAVDLQMLPSDTPIEAVSKYLDDNIAIASYSPALDHFLSSVLNRGSMTSLELIGHLRLPDILRASELDEFRAFLNVMISFPRSGSSQALMVPNGNLRLTPVGELYDHSIPLLSSAFKSTESISFVHHSLWDLQSSLHLFGLQHEVNFDVFLVCAREIDRVHKRDDAMESAEKAYAHYRSVLPREIMMNETKWGALDSLRFVPRLAERHPYLDGIYDVTTYCEELPAIVAPGKLLREEFEAVAWTQRGLFREQPPRNLVAVNPTLGEPRVEEVVCFGGHLRS
jgi:hypothetical protein